MHILDLKKIDTNNLQKGIFLVRKREKQIKTFVLEARKHNISIICEPPNSGVDDWITIANDASLHGSTEGELNDTEFPLIKLYNI